MKKFINKDLFDKISFGRLINKFKESKKFKIVGLVIILIILIITIIGVSVDIAPKNSVTIYVVDQNGKGINGLELIINKVDDTESYQIKYTKKMKKNRAVGLDEGDYELTFTNIPKGYTCFTVFDEFSMEKDEKKKLEYECLKS